MAPHLTQLHFSRFQPLTTSQLRTALSLPSSRSLGFCLDPVGCPPSTFSDVLHTQGLRLFELFLACVKDYHDLHTLTLFLEMIAPTSKHLRNLCLFLPYTLSRTSITPTCQAVRLFEQLESLTVRTDFILLNETDGPWPLSELPMRHLADLSKLTRLSIHALPIMATSEFVNIASKQWPKLTHLTFTSPLVQFELPVLMTLPYRLPRLVFIFTLFATLFPDCITHIHQPQLSAPPIIRTITLRECQCDNPFMIVIFVKTYFHNVRFVGHGFLAGALAMLEDNNTSVSSHLSDHPSLINYPFLTNAWFASSGGAHPS